MMPEKQKTQLELWEDIKSGKLLKKKYQDKNGRTLEDRDQVRDESGEIGHVVINEFWGDLYISYPAKHEGGYSYQTSVLEEGVLEDYEYVHKWDNWITGR